MVATAAGIANDLGANGGGAGSVAVLYHGSFPRFAPAGRDSPRRGLPGGGADVGSGNVHS